MPQFTFACFCGLHGLCGRKKKKKEQDRQPRQEYETEVWDDVWTGKILKVSVAYKENQMQDVTSVSAKISGLRNRGDISTLFMILMYLPVRRSAYFHSLDTDRSVWGTEMQGSTVALLKKLIFKHFKMYIYI